MNPTARIDSTGTAMSSRWSWDSRRAYPAVAAIVTAEAARSSRFAPATTGARSAIATPRSADAAQTASNKIRALSVNAANAWLTSPIAEQAGASPSPRRGVAAAVSEAAAASEAKTANSGIFAYSSTTTLLSLPRPGDRRVGCVMI
ncbi:MAG: hypothetical protein LC679_00660 [Intrasporangiaceae bacterium]|nr:hypothetical protein [Intrasporangiaceae bacterium]